MADEAEDVLELEDEQVLDEADEAEDDDQQDDGGAEEDGEDDGDEPEVFVGFDGEEAAPASESENSVIRELRGRIREQAKRLAELERGSAPEEVEVGPEPTLEGADYDEDRFKADWQAWTQRKAQAERQQSEKQQRVEAEKEAFNKRVQAFEAGKAKLGVADFDDAETTVAGVLPNETMAIILHSEKSAELVYALSRAPGKLDELSKLNPLKAAMMVGKLEDKVQTRTTRKPPNPDRPVRGNAAPAAADKTLARLEKEAERTGDRTAVIRYKRELRSKA